MWDRGTGIVEFLLCGVISTILCTLLAICGHKAPTLHGEIKTTRPVSVKYNSCCK